MSKAGSCALFSHIMFPFNYCPLLWIFCSKQANKLIDEAHFRALRVRFNDFSSSFEKLLVKSNCKRIHSRNLEPLVTEVSKCDVP